MKPFYKWYLVGGVVLAVMTFALCAMEGSGRPFEICYGEIYNRVHFLTFYVPMFLIGMGPIAARLSVCEIAVRYGKQFEFAWDLEKRILFYSGYMASVFLLINLLVMFLFCQGWESVAGSALFLIVAFYFQWVGWAFVGNSFLLLELFCKNVGWTYFFMLGFLIITVLAGASERLDKIGYFVSVHAGAYFFFELPLWEVVLLFLYGCLLATGLMWAIYWRLKNKDWIGNVKKREVM